MIAQLDLLAAPAKPTPDSSKLYRFLMRCPKKGCKTIHRVTIPGRQVTRFTRGIIGVPGSAQSYKSWEPVWPMLELHCREHRYLLRTELIKGQYSEKHVCDSRCINAIGSTCECSCGGENHGAAWEGGTR